MIDRNAPMAILDQLLIGYRVKAQPRFDAPMKFDMFELRHAAIECADRCASLGWVGIGIETVYEAAGEQWTEPVEWTRKEEAA